MANPIFHARMKYIEVNFHFARDMVCQGHLDIQFISSNDQLADALTKPLPKDQIIRFQANLREDIRK